MNGGLCVAFPRWAQLLALLLSVGVPEIGHWAAEAAAPARPVFPLKVGGNGRYLCDQTDQPFLLLGDTPWSLIVQPSEADIDRYLEDRQRRGFNAIIVNLIEHKFCSSPPRTRSGLAPFKRLADFSALDDGYFDFAHRVIQKANARGIVAWLAPAYLGFGGGDEGFFREMKAGGRERLHAYGTFVGQRFKDLPNIVWLLGGDFTPEEGDRWTVSELALAIQEQDPNHLMTVHAAPENSAASIFGREPWLSVDTVYSYESNLFRPLIAEYQRKPARPFVLIESTYEGEHSSKPEQIRRQAYWSMLSGACGQFFGNNSLWHFDGPGLFPSPGTWQQAMDSPGSRDMSRLGALFRDLPWYRLQPEEDHAVIVNGYGTGLATALTALTSDRKLSITYIPSTGTPSRELTINARQFSGSVQPRWFNPTTGNFMSVKLSGENDGGLFRISTPGDNGTTANDWVLLVEAH